RLGAETDRLTERHLTLSSKRAALAEQTQLSEASRLELSRMTVELEQLELTLAELKAVRQRDRQTYSVVPYRGKRGDNRKPLYVECTSSGLVFHPDRLVVDSAERMRAEVERRVAKQKSAAPAASDKANENAYLLMLVRPDGIGTCYRRVAARRGVKADFGYAFNERDTAPC